MSDEDLFAVLLDGGPLEAPVSLRPLLAVASALQSETLAVATAPAAPFRFQLRNTLVREARSKGIGQRVSSWVGATNTRLQRRTRFVAAMSMAVMAMLGTSAVFAAASSSVPGDPLYGVKRLHETARLTVLSGAPEGRLRLDLARVRLSEVRSLKERGVVNDALYIQTLDVMDRLTTTGAVILLDLYDRTGDRSAVDFVEDFTTDQVAGLSELVPQLPPGVRPAARDSLGLVEATAREVEIKLAGCGACPVDPLLNTPTAKEQGRASRSPGCACPAETDTSEPTEPDPGTEEPDPTEPDGGTTPPPPEPPFVDLPPETPDDAEEPAEQLIDQIVDGIKETLPPPVAELLPSNLPTTGDLGL